MSKKGNYDSCIPRRFNSECQKGLKCQKLSLLEKMSMSPEDRKTGYVCKPRSKYTKVHSRIERERQKEREKGTLKADSLVKSSPIKIKTRSLFRSRGGRKTRKKKRTRTKRRRKQKGGFDTITINDIYSSIDKDNYEICGEARYNSISKQNRSLFS